MKPAVEVLWLWLQEPASLAPLPAHCRAGRVRVTCVDENRSVALALSHSGATPLDPADDVDCTWFTDSEQLAALLGGDAPAKSPLRVQGDAALLTSLAAALQAPQAAYRTRLRGSRG